MILTDEEIGAFSDYGFTTKAELDLVRTIEQSILDKLQDKLKNAERYEWLRDVGNTWDVYHIIGDGLHTKELDKAIDSAIAKERN